MAEYKLKTGKVAEKVVNSYRSIEDSVVGGYKKMEDNVVSGYKKIENKFVETFFEEVNEDSTSEE